ncbi:MAG: VWA domain-containing protein [Rickettsiales bacterium]|jgi:Ca-activated chloride channel homolog|nr:VWA domain-containing protein [Rickettsiales bacterium]
MDLTKIFPYSISDIIYNISAFNWVDIDFARPFYLALIIVPLVWFLFLQNIFKIQKNANIFIPFTHLEELQRSSYRNNITFRSIYIFVIWAILIIAIAGPIKIENNRYTERNGYRISLVIDTSLSMNALDFSINKNNYKTRLDVIKEVITNFINLKTNDLFALITFGDFPVLQSPMTSDNTTIIKYLENSYVGEFGNSTAIGDALALAIDSLKPYSKSKVIILLTDGSNSSGKYSPETIAYLAKDQKIPIYTIGIGKNKKVPLLIGKNQIRYEYLPLDEASLKSISNITNGKYFKVNDTKDLKKVYSEISKLTKIKLKNFDNIQITYYHYHLLIMAIIMIILAHLIKVRRLF